MRIDNSLNKPPATPTLPEPTAGGARRSSSSSPGESSGYATGTDLLQLINLARQVPELRQEVIGEIAQRLAQNPSYSTTFVPSTVQAILQSNGLGL
jgi:hypothetical protein